MNARILYVTLPIALLLALTCPLYAQDAAGDQAKALLKQGMDQYRALELPAAKATLLKVDASALGDADKKILEDSLAKIDPAIKQQAAAREAMADAEKALKDNDLAKAKEGFATAAGSDYLTDPERKDARTQLAQVQGKLDKSGAAAEPAKAVVAEAPVAIASSVAVTATAAAASSISQGTLDALQAERLENAKKLIIQGKSELDNKQPDKAILTFERAKSLAPENTEIPELLAQAQKLVGGGDDTLGRYAQQRAILRDIALMEFGKNMQRSQEALTGADSESRFAAAAAAAEAARTQVISNKDVFSSTQEYEAKLREAENQIKYVATQKDVYNQKQASFAAEEVERNERSRVAKIMESKRTTIATLKTRAKALQTEQKYQEALNVLEQILQLDPNDEYAAGSKDTLIVMRNMHDEKNAYDTMRDEWMKQQIYTRKAEIPWSDELTYPKNWRELTIKREAYSANAANVSEADRAVRMKLRNKIQRLDFNNDEFGTVIDFFRTVSNVNFHPNWQALAAASVERKTPVNLNLSDVTVEKALDLVLADLSSTVKLGYVIGDGVVTISTKDDLAKVPVNRTYDVADLLFVVPDFTGPVMSLTTSGNNNGSNNPWSNNNNNNNDNNNNNNNGSRAAMIDQIITTIKSTVDKESWSAPGIGAIQEFHGQLIVTQTAENQELISKLLTMLRESKSLQISIEARFVQVNSGFFNSIGINVNTYFNLGSQLGGAPAGGGPNYTIDPFTGTPVPTKGTSGWGNGKPGSNELTPMGVIQGKKTTDHNVPYAPGFGGMSSLSAAAPPSSIAQALGGTPSMQIAGTFLDDIQVDFIVQATQANSTTRTLTAPRLTLFNGQQAYVTVGEQRNYVSSLIPLISENATAAAPTIGTVLDGSVLQVQATVSADRRYVTLTVQPQVSKVVAMDTFTISSLGSLQLPRVVIQSVATTVTVPDGGTLLLGGMMTSSEEEQEGGVPILSKIPFIERFFTNRGKVRDENTLLILIKPKIIIQREQEEDFFPPTK